MPKTTEAFVNWLRGLAEIVVFPLPKSSIINYIKWPKSKFLLFYKKPKYYYCWFKFLTFSYKKKFYMTTKYQIFIFLKCQDNLWKLKVEVRHFFIAKIF